MNALILSGGFGSRLGYLGEKHPKALLDIGGRPLIDWIIERIIEIEIIDNIVVLCNGFFESQFTAWWVKHEDRKKISLISNGVSSPEKRLGAMGDVNFSLQRESLSGPLTIFPCDTIFTFNVRKFFCEVKHTPQNGWLCLRTERTKRKEESVELLV